MSSQALPWRNRLALAGGAWIAATFMAMLWSTWHGVVSPFVLITTVPAAFLYMKLVTLSPKKACHFMDYRIFAMCLICCATAYACTTLFNGQWYISIAIGMTMMLPVALPSVKARP